MFPALVLLWDLVSKFTVCVFGPIITFIIFRFQDNENFIKNESGSGLSRFNGFKENEEEENDLVATSSKCDFLHTMNISGFIEEPKTEIFNLKEFYMDSTDTAETSQIQSWNVEYNKIEDEFESCITENVTEMVAKADFEEKTDESDEEKAAGDCAELESLITESTLEKQETEANRAVDEKTWRFLERLIAEKGFDEQESGKETEEAVLVERLEAFVRNLEKQEKEESDVAVQIEVTVPPTSVIETNSEDQKTFNLEDHKIEQDLLSNYHHEQIESNPQLDDSGGEPANLSSESCSEEFISSFKEEEEEEEEEKEEEEEEEEKAVIGLEDHKIGQDLVNDNYYTEKGESNPQLDDSGGEPVNLGSESCSEEFNSSFEEEEEEEEDIEYEQLKMQLKMARTGGLPTISEESEFSKMEEQLEPLNTEKKLDLKDQIAEIQKMYKSYYHKMKKLDILNSQTTHAIGLLQLKDPVKLKGAAKSSALPMKSLLSKNIWSSKQAGKEMNDRVMKLVRDLEVVYVGQMCHSWEILRWQYEKVQELVQSDPQKICRYNHVVGEFQLFQVLLHRFLENEPFQGRPRVENYTNNRCLFQNFLQIPVIKGNKGARVNEEETNGTSTAMLIETMEESMQVFWEFVRADKDDMTSSLNLKAPQHRQVAPQDPLDLGLLANVRTDLQKKEKRMKEIVRSKTCIIKKLQKHQRTPLDRLTLIAQVDLKLVSRVLKMSKLSTDHLVWCHEKLEKIEFCSGKVKMEPSILLFPC